MLLSDRIRDFLGSARARANRRRGARLAIGLVAVFVTAVSVIHAPAARAILEAHEIAIAADIDQSPAIDDCLECGKCVRDVSCTMQGIVDDAALAPLAAKWAWNGATAERGPGRATAPPVRPPVTGFERSREPS